jgi:excisionase family DNA binding protein
MTNRPPTIMGRPRFEDLPDVLTPRDVMEYLRLGRNATYSLLKNGTLRSLRLGQKFLIPRQALLDGGGERGVTGTPVKGHA